MAVGRVLVFAAFPRYEVMAERPGSIYLLTHDFIKADGGWSYEEVFHLIEYSDDGRCYQFSRYLDDVDLGEYGSSEELVLKFEILGYAPCFKDFIGNWHENFSYDEIGKLTEEKSNDGIA